MDTRIDQVGSTEKEIDEEYGCFPSRKLAARLVRIGQLAKSHRQPCHATLLCKKFMQSF